MESNRAYKTYILGTLGNVKDCLRIVLFNKKFLSTSKTTRITLYNLEEVYSYIQKPNISTNKSIYVSLQRETSKDYFKYKGNDDGFDIIIYIDNATELPIGYTEFSSVQGLDISVDIDLEFSGNYETSENLKIVNSLSTATLTPLSERNIIGENLKDYISSTKAIEWIEKNSRGTGYTSHLEESLVNYSNIALTSGIIKKVTNEPQVVRLNINKDDGFIDSKNNYNHYSFGYLNGDTVIYLWNDNNEYNIISLTKTNRFGHSVIYTKSNTNTNNVISLANSSSIKILYGAGKYFVCEVTSNGKKKNRVFDITDKSWISESITGENFFIDPLDLSSKIYRFPSGILTKEILVNRIPSIKDTYEDISTFITSESLYPSIVRKVGNWYIFRYKREKSYVYIFFGIYSTVFMTEEDYKNIIILNDTTLILNEDSGYILYAEPEDEIVRRLYTERYKYLTSKESTRQLEETVINYSIKQKTYNKESNKFSVIYNSAKIPMFNYYRDDELVYTGADYFLEYEGRVAPKSEYLLNTFLNNFRKNRYPESISGIPEIIGAINGILFYKDKNNLNYL